jgi:hypothetical protein
MPQENIEKKKPSAKKTKSPGNNKKRISDLGNKAKAAYKKIPKNLVQKYKKTLEDHKKFIIKREEKLDQLKEIDPHKLTKPIVKKKNASPTKKKAEEISLDDNSAAAVIFDSECASEFDTTQLSLTNRRAKVLQHFFKLLIFNHPFKESFVKNNWFIGQVLRYKQEWRPAGFGLGELIKSFSLLPLEETTLELTVWEKTKSEIEKIEDEDTKKEAEESSKRNDSKEITDESTEKHGWHVEASGSIGFGIGSASMSAGAEGSSESHAKSMKAEAKEKTKSTSSSISQKRSVKIGSATESGSENKTIRIIKNTNRCHTVTYNFFQLLKIYDLIMTLEDAPLALLFPNAKKHLSNPAIRAMYQRMFEAFTDFSSDFAFITQYLRIDSELGRALGYGASDPGLAEDLSGTALVFTVKDPVSILEGLIYFFGYIVGDDLVDYEIATLTDIVEKYIENDIALRIDDQNEPVDSLEILTHGIYVDSMIGQCSACEDYVRMSRAHDLMMERRKIRDLEIKNLKNEKEIERREKLLAADILDPFLPQESIENEG